MEWKDIPQNGWLFGLKYQGPGSLQDRLICTIKDSEDITEAKSRIITEMTGIMVECAKVINHANAMRDDPACTTCNEKCGGKP